MTKPIARDPIYRRRRFEAEIMELCVRWHITYRLSYRDLVGLMAERGLDVSHTTIMRWVVRYVPEFEKQWNRWARKVNSSWRVDETYVCVRGKWHYLYRAVDKVGKDRRLSPSAESWHPGVTRFDAGDTVAAVVCHASHVFGTFAFVRDIAGNLIEFVQQPDMWTSLAGTR